MTEKEEHQIKFGRRIKEVRKKAGSRAEDVAELAGISSQFLSDVERGKKDMTGYNIANLAKALGVESDYLLLGRRDTKAELEEIAGQLADIDAVTRDMALNMLTVMLKMINDSKPELSRRA